MSLSVRIIWRADMYSLVSVQLCSVKGEVSAPDSGLLH